eukprot:scaffold72626_cov61-Phaeocystis_antarctica.AAC.4
MPLPAAFLMACLTWSSRLLYCKLQRGSHKRVVWVREHARPTRLTGGHGLGPRGARWRAASRRWEWGKGVCVRLRASAGSASD